MTQRAAFNLITHPHKFIRRMHNKYMACYNDRVASSMHRYFSVLFLPKIQLTAFSSSSWCCDRRYWRA